ncbi:UvrD-helicase domain-containing protein, partial [Deinococcus sp. 23YEL01]|uniref:UvrD-helicase domain-containing protein n=1 Tax=Deinococcus sp. 23YEL01 TaxID=2745871 RepID=UPI001E3258F4|nr:UvrD-helicase domain-containing protein [Deinococcus sp. 23YEL01]
MSLTDAQQRAAHAPSSVAVMAGAGSGKTHMLVARYLHHLDTLSPLEIVATTFTEKAAAELRARIRRGVQASRPDDFDTLAELEAAQISTIHALCARIVRDHPAAAGVRPDVTILDEGQARVWRARHLRPALAALPARLFTHLSFSAVA